MKNLDEQITDTNKVVNQKQKIIRVTGDEYAIFNVIGMEKGADTTIIKYRRKDGSEWRKTVRNDLIESIDEEVG